MAVQSKKSANISGRGLRGLAVCIHKAAGFLENPLRKSKYKYKLIRKMKENANLFVFFYNTFPEHSGVPTVLYGSTQKGYHQVATCHYYACHNEEQMCSDTTRRDTDNSSYFVHPRIEASKIKFSALNWISYSSYYHVLFVLITVIYS